MVMQLIYWNQNLQWVGKQYAQMFSVYIVLDFVALSFLDLKIYVL